MVVNDPLCLRGGSSASHAVACPKHTLSRPTAYLAISGQDQLWRNPKQNALNSLGLLRCYPAPTQGIDITNKEILENSDTICGGNRFSELTTSSSLHGLTFTWNLHRWYLSYLRRNKEVTALLGAPRVQTLCAANNNLPICSPIFQAFLNQGMHILFASAIT